MDNDVVISVENVTMAFNLNKEKVDNLKEYVIKLLRRQLEFKKFYALQDINFQVRRGQHLGILGLNGAGKSTLLKTIVGVYKPTEGVFKYYGFTRLCFCKVKALHSIINQCITIKEFSKFNIIT